MSSRKKSKVWDNFEEDDNTGICKHCRARVKRGKEMDRSLEREFKIAKRVTTNRWSLKSDNVEKIVIFKVQSENV